MEHLTIDEAEPLEQRQAKVQRLRVDDKLQLSGVSLTRRDVPAQDIDLHTRYVLATAMHTMNQTEAASYRVSFRGLGPEGKYDALIEVRERGYKAPGLRAALKRALLWLKLIPE